MKLASEIIVAAGYDLKVDLRHKYNYESCIIQEVSAGKYTALVREYGSIDTNHQLILVNTEDEICAAIDNHLVSTPAYCMGVIRIVSLVEVDDGVSITYSKGVGATAPWTEDPQTHTRKLSLKAKLVQHVVTDLKELS